MTRKGTIIVLSGVVLVGTLLWIYSRPLKTVSHPVAQLVWSDRPTTLPFEVQMFDVVSGLDRQHSTSLSIAPKNKTSDWQDAFLVVDRPNFIDFMIEIHSDGTIEISIAPEARQYVRRQQTNVTVGPGIPDVTVKYTDDWRKQHNR